MGDLSYWGIGGVPTRSKALGAKRGITPAMIDDMLENILGTYETPESITKAQGYTVQDPIKPKIAPSKGTTYEEMAAKHGKNPYKDMKLPEHLGGESSEIMSKVKRPAWKDAVDGLLERTGTLAEFEKTQPNQTSARPPWKDALDKVPMRSFKDVADLPVEKSRGGTEVESSGAYGPRNKEEVDYEVPNRVTEATRDRWRKKVAALTPGENVDIIDKDPSEEPKYDYDEPIGPKDQPAKADEDPEENTITVEGSAPSPRKDVEGTVGYPEEKSVFKQALEGLFDGGYDVKKSSKAARSAKRARYARRQKEADRWMAASDFKRSLAQINNPWAGR